MLIDTNTQTYIDAFSYDVKRSRNRQKVILLLDMNRKTPTDLVDEMDVGLSLISRTLSELKDKNIVKCIKEHEKLKLMQTNRSWIKYMKN